MLRGQLTSVELYRGLISPLFKRNLSVAAVRYADEKDASKVEGIFSWLKDVLRPEGKVNEAVNVINRRATWPEIHGIRNTELKYITDQNIRDVVRSFKSPKFNETWTAIQRNPVNYPDYVSNRNYGVYTSAKQTYRPLYLDPLTLAEQARAQIRTIVSCAPRSTKPPIREPNMPEQQQKKEDKKEKKKKKPVIRMESGISEKCENEATVECRNDLYDNLDVNFQWGIRLPDELEKKEQQLNQEWEVGLKRTENSLAADTNYSSYQVSSSQTMEAIQAIRDLQVNMSSAKDAEKGADAVGDKRTEKSDKAKAKSAESSSASPKVAEKKEAKEASNIESLKKILKTSPIVMKETSVVDEDYNVPNNATFDAELAAWKDLVLKSKVPVDPTKEEYIETDRRAEMLSIRPEPPQPKLDVQAVPTTDDSIKDDEDEVEFSRDVKGNATTMDVRRTGSPSDIQKIDSKKLHTGPFCWLRRHSGDGFNGRLRVNNPWILELLENNGNVAAPDFSTSSEGAWTDSERNSAEGGGSKQESMDSEPQGNLSSGQEPERSGESNLENKSSNETGMAQDQREQTESQDSMESSLRVPPSQRDSKKYETDDHVLPLADDLQLNSDYTYEDDFYPSYESMSLEHQEKPSDQNQEQPLTAEEQQRMEEDRELLSKQAEQALNANEYTIDSNYIKVPGDPYPYSKEHFNKWRMTEDIRIGPADKELEPDLLNTSINSPTPVRRVEIQQPVRKMSLDSHIRETPDDVQH